MIYIRFLTKIYDNHSLAIVSRKLCLQLIKDKRFNINIVPLDKFNPEWKVNKDELVALKPYINTGKEKCDIELRHSYPPMLTWPKDNNTKVVFIQPWEYNRMPLEWKDLFQEFADAVFVPSTWVSDVYINSGINPRKIKVVPNGYDPLIFNDAPLKTNLLDSSKFIFTYVGSAQHRKGIDILFQAWHKAFVKADNAVLFIKDTPQIYGQTNILENLIQLQYKSGCAKIVYNDESLSEEEMAGIYKNTDILVHPYRGEGFGMHIQEAMACGALPMVTGIGAANDFVNEACGIKLNARQQIIDANDPKYFIGKPGDSYTNMGSHFWVPEVMVDDLAGKMRFVYYHHERQKILDTVSNAKLWTWKAASEILAEQLIELSLKTEVCRINDNSKHKS
jgi:glycosyltransferase involved in cell wall biosynthesis